MTEELLSLLRRVHAAGGPIRFDDDDELVIRLADGALHSPDWQEDWDSHREAVLIHALLLDVIGRGAEFGLSFSRGEQEHKAVVILRDGTTSEVDDDSAAVAMARAWLAAFEETE